VTVATAAGARPKTSELRAALEVGLATPTGMPPQILRIMRRPSPYASSFALEELDVELDGAPTLRLIFKDLGWRRMPPGARHSKPAFLYDPMREISAYALIRAHGLAGPPGALVTAIDATTDRYWLLLDRIDGVPLSEVGDAEGWRLAARWLAGMHSRFAGEAEALCSAPHFLRYDRAFFQAWIDRAVSFAAGSGPRRRAIDWLAARYDRVVDRLVALPPTFIHGEFYASNVLMRRYTGRAGPIAPIDWEMAGVGPPLIDVAALTAGQWNEEERLALAAAYHAALPTELRSDWDELLTRIQLCRVHVAIQWLGWARTWSPPEAHAQDWIEEAVRIAEALDL
jgi:aminoglycoside phosphotransferase (APT) family kinase protein